jgi:hypothetical protein
LKIFSLQLFSSFFEVEQVNLKSPLFALSKFQKAIKELKSNLQDELEACQVGVI